MALISFLAGDESQPSSFRKRFSLVSLCFFSLLVVFLVLTAPLSAWAAAISKIELSPKEQAWLAAHPNINFGFTDSFEPFLIMGDNGKKSGVLADFLNKLNQRLGTQFGLEVDPWSIMLEKTKKRELSGVLAIAAKTADTNGLLKTRQIFSVYPSFYTRSDAPFTINNLDDIGGRSVAILKSAQVMENILEPFKDEISILKLSSNLECLQMLFEGKVDIAFGLTTQNYLITKYKLGGIYAAYTMWNRPIEVVMGVRPDLPELVTILNKGVASFSQQEIDSIATKWLLDTPKKSSIEIRFTAEEKAWLMEHPTVRTRFHKQPPYMYLKHGKTAGMTADLLNKISEKVDIKFAIEKTPNRWADDLGLLIRHEAVDMLPSIMATPERENVILFTEPYVTSPRFIYTRDDAPFISSIKELTGQTIAVVKNYAVHNELVEKHPSIDLRVFDTVEKAIRAVSSGKVFAFIGDLFSTPALINELGLNNLKAACPSGLTDHSLAIGVRNDWPELRDILDKALVAISAAEKAAIINKWSTVKFEHGIRYEDVKKWGVMVVLLVSGPIVLFIIWNRTLKKQVQERTAELSASEQRFRAIFEQAAVGIAHVSVDGHFLRLNQKFCDIVGYPLEEMRKKTSQEITHPDDLDQDLHLLQQLLNGEADSYTLEKRYICKDSAIIWVNLTVRIVRKGDSTPAWFVSVIKDISDRKQAEKALQKSHDFLNHLTSTVPDAIFAVKMPERTVQWCSDSFGVLGYEPEECVGETTQKFYSSPEEANKVGLLLNRVAESGEDLVRTEALLRRKNGEIFPAEISVAVQKQNGEAVAATALARDISERKKAEKALQQSHDLLKHLTSSIPDAVFSVKLPERVIEWVEDSYNIMGLAKTPEYAAGQSTKKYFASIDEYNTFGELQKKAIQEGKKFMRTEVRLRGEDGTIFPAEVTGTFYRENGEVTKITALARDITDRRLAEQRLLDYQSRLKSLASELTVVEERERRRIAEDLHDNVGQSLTLSLLQLAAASKSVDDVTIKEQFDELSQTLFSAVQDTQHLIFELSSPTMTDLGLGAAIAEWIEHKIKPRHALDITVVDKHERDRLGNDQNVILFRSVRELLTNILKHARADKASVLLENVDNAVRVTVKDNGIGFNPEFTKPHPGKEGGLGLFSIEERMSNFGGSMLIDSKAHHGTTIVMTIPYCETKQEATI